MDDNLRLLSALVHLNVISRTTTLPDAPADGAIYIVKIGDVNANKVALRDNGAWVYVDPFEGMRAWIKDEDVFRYYTGAAWATESAALSAEIDGVEFQALVSTIDFTGNGFELEDLGDGKLRVTLTSPQSFEDFPNVDYTTPPLEGQVLVFDGPSQTWIPTSISGVGTPMLADLGDVDVVTTPPADGQTLVWDEVAGKFVPGDGGGSAPVFSVGTFIAGKPAASEKLIRYKTAAPFTLPAGLTGSQFVAETAATASTAFSITRNGVAIGTLTFAAAGTVPTVAFASGTAFAAGDVLGLDAPGTADTTLADISFTFLGAV